MKFLRLEGFSRFFKDGAAFDEFVKLFSEAAGHDDFTILAADNGVVCYLFPEVLVRRLLVEEVVKRQQA